MMTLTLNYPNELGYPNRLASNSSYFPSDGWDDTVQWTDRKRNPVRGGDGASGHDRGCFPSE